MNVRCLACGTVFWFEPAMPMCPARYLSPHDEAFLEAVARELAKAGAATADAPPEEHRAAIARAMERLKAEDEREPPLTR